MQSTDDASPVLDAIRQRVAAKSSLRRVGKEVGLTAGYLSDILMGRRLVSERVAKLFGFERIAVTTVRFVAINKAAE